jgi:hypothetical protein
MGKDYVISDYCIIRHGRVIWNGEIVFEGRTAPVADFLTAIYRHLNVGYPKFFKMDNLCKLGLLASELLVHDKKLTEKYPEDRIGLILSNAASSLDTDRNHQASINDRAHYFPSPSVFVYTLANIVIGEICIRHRFLGEGTFLIEESFDPARLHGYVHGLLLEGAIDCCITGWVELDRDSYEAVLYLVQKPGNHNDGIAIFEPGNLYDIYLQRI